MPEHPVYPVVFLGHLQDLLILEVVEAIRDAEAQLARQLLLDLLPLQNVILVLVAGENLELHSYYEESEAFDHEDADVACRLKLNLDILPERDCLWLHCPRRRHSEKVLKKRRVEEDRVRYLYQQLEEHVKKEVWE